MTEESEFQWPEDLAAAVHSVRSHWQRDPLPPRIFSVSNDECRTSLEAFDTKTIDYYKTYLYNKFTAEKLRDILKQRFSDVGDTLTSGGNKVTLIDRIKESDRAYLVLLYKQITAGYLANILHRPLRTIDEGCQIKVTSNNKSLSLTLNQIRQFNTDKALRFDVMQYMIHLLNERYKLLADTHFRKNGRDKNYSPLKNIVYMICSPQTGLSELAVTVLANMNKVFICFKKSIDDDKDDWVALIVDFVRKSVFYVDPEIGGETLVNDTMKNKFIEYNQTITAWMNSCNWSPDKPFECKLYPKDEHNFEPIQNKVDSGIYIVVTIDMVTHDCPRYFTQHDSYIFRQNLCYGVLNN